MRYRKTVKSALFALGALAVFSVSARGQAFVATDWLMHRATAERAGSNGVRPFVSDPGILGRVWIWPPPGDMPAEMAVDDEYTFDLVTGATTNQPMFPPPDAGGVRRWSLAAAGFIDSHHFGVEGAWSGALPGSDRGIGAWPPFDTSPDPNDPARDVLDTYKAEDYLFTDAVYDQELDKLANLDLRPGVAGAEGLDRLRMLPNIDSFDPEPSLGDRNFYQVVDERLRACEKFARWSFGARYPVGTAQGTRDVSGDPLQPNQRYAVYIRYPSSGTRRVAGGPVAPNTDWVFVRVSWGDDPNDPRLSRIFMLNFGDTGGFWKRVRSSQNEDRYFPYDGQHPITVTLYACTFSATNELGIQTIVPADAVRLVPEAHRGDINASASSAVFPPGADIATTPGAVRLTYFGRDETSGPRLLLEPANINNTEPPGGFLGVPFNPTLPIQNDPNRPNYNPTIADPTSSIRSAVFYCFEDFLPTPVAGDFRQHRYGKLRWRYVARTRPVAATTIDDEPLPTPTAGGFDATAGFVPANDTNGLVQAFGGNTAGPTPAVYHVAAAVAPQAAPAPPYTESAVWNRTLTNTVPGGTYSVFVWIPAEERADPAIPGAREWAHRAHYFITTDNGVQEVFLDQRNTQLITDPALIQRQTNVGQWRRLATGIRFPIVPGAPAGTETVQATVLLGNDSEIDAANGRHVVADAIQFVPESQTRNSVVAAPTIAQVTWPSGRTRHVVYFATMSGHVWALDALGPDQDANGNPALDAAGAPVHTGTHTTAYWVYPSISDPLAADPDPNCRALSVDKNQNGVFDGPEDDPNYNPDPRNNVPQQGIDGDVEQVNVPGVGQVWQVDQDTEAPDLAGFSSSPLYVEVAQGNARIPLLILGNNNGRVYALDPIGRVNEDVNCGPVGEPFRATFATNLVQGGVAESPGVPGTTRRLMTWPTIKRDKWLDAGGRPGGTSITRYEDDPGKGSFAASLSAFTPATGTEWVVGGAADGHVYCVDLQTLDIRDRISNPNNNGSPRWRFPSERQQLGPITQPGVLTTTNKYIFSAPDLRTGGGRVYAINLSASQNGATATRAWTYPFTSEPGAFPLGTDQPPIDTPFTAPAWLPSLLGINGGNEIAFVANTDGRVFGFNASLNGNVAGQLLQEWQDFDPNNPGAGQVGQMPSRSFGVTSASAVFVSNLRPLRRFLDRNVVDPQARIREPGILLPLDTGDLVAFSARTGDLIYTMPDGAIGGVPLNIPDPPAPAPVIAGFPFPTSHVWRSADAITVDRNNAVSGGEMWMFQGDRGNQDAGEVNGQMRAYAYGQFFSQNVTPDMGQVNPDQMAVDIRIVDIFNGANDTPPGPWDNFAPNTVQPVLSPYNEKLAGNVRPNTQGNVVVWEWGDTIKVAAWGATYYDPTNPACPNIFPEIVFRMNTGRQNREQRVRAVQDPAYNGPPLVIDAFTGDTCAVVPWVAKTQFQLGRGSAVDAQTPGTRYTIQARAELTIPGAGTAFSETLGAGQFDPQPYDPIPGDALGTPSHTVNDLPPPRLMSVAHPLAMTTRGFDPNNTPMVGTGFRNIIGWTNGQPPDNLTGDITEILANGNVRWDPTLWRQDPAGPVKDLVAPMGFIGHGASGVYTGLLNGRRVPALYIADRSNLYKLNQPLNNVRVERTDLGWGWNPNSLDPWERATGNAMNPLPWERFPIETPNTSLDYPNMGRDATAFRGNGMDMGARSIALPRPNIQNGQKILSPLQIELQVSVPQFQPANVNRAYFDLRGQMKGGNGLIAPLRINTGGDVGEVPGNDSIHAQASAGYVGQFFVYVDTNNNGRLESQTSPGSAQQAVQTGVEEVFRQLAVGVGIPPDIRLRSEEETLDLGNLPHSTGYNPVLPFAPSGLGPYSLGFGTTPFLSPFNFPGIQQYFAPFTVRNSGNVNLWNVRVAKIIGQGAAAVNTPANWGRLTSDQVETITGVGQIWSVPFFPSAQNDGRGNIGIVTTLDHGHSNAGVPQFEIDYTARFNLPNFWPLAPNAGNALLGNPYVPALPLGSPFAGVGFATATQPRPTLHKPRVGDPGPTTLSIPDVAHGDPLGVLATVSTGQAPVPGRETRPMIGLAIPMGTPAGTYSVQVYTYEDRVPEQWRQWADVYSSITGTQNQTVLAVDDDGLLNVNAARAPIESVANPTFQLKATVRENRLTNGPSVPIGAPNGTTYQQITGDYPQVDLRLAQQGGVPPAFGANLQPSALVDQRTRSLLLFWASNRLNNATPLANPTPDMPWYLNFSQLAQEAPSLARLDWLFEPFTGNRVSWWKPLPADTQYPAPPWVASPYALFPSQAGQAASANIPVVPGAISPNTERHGSPALAQDSVTQNAPVWLFWQGAVYKTMTPGANPAAAQNFRVDARTFYTQLVNGDPTGPILSYLNDPNLEKFGPKPLILTDVNNNQRAYLFWYGGPRGRTRLYFNRTSDLTDPRSWSRDRALATPGTLQWQADPSVAHKRVYITDPATGQPVLRDVVDVTYTGILAYRQQAETFLTRYRVAPNGDLEVVELPRVDNELLVREGASQTWVSRDLAWIYRDRATGRLLNPSANEPAYLISVLQPNGTLISPVTVGPPTFDPATGFLHFASQLGGSVILDPQSGRVTFTGAAPARTAQVLASYTPQTMRLNVTRNDHNAVAIPAGWTADQGFALRPHVNAPGSNTQPVAFIDRMTNPRVGNIEPANANMPITRMWLFYRKSNSNVTATAAIYYKTMRLMVRLPRGVLRSQTANGLDARPNVQVAGNRGPYEIDWARGRIYFTEADEGNLVRISFNYARNQQGQTLSVPPTDYRVAWGDEISTAVQPGDQVTNETMLPADAAVNEGQISALKDPFADKVWVFWSSSRAGTSDLYSMAISPQFYPNSPQ